MNTKGSGAVWPIAEGIYRGTVEGIESGHCTARIEIRVGPGGCRIVDFEAVSDAQGLQHIEHGLLTDDELHLAFGEAAGVTTFRSAGDGVYQADGPRPMQVHIGYDGVELTWAWHWGTTSEDVVQRSLATCTRADC